MADKWTYATNSSVLANVAFGADVSLILEPRAGNTFAPTGLRLANVDGGGFGNLWKRWGATVYNSPLKNAWGDFAGTAGLVALSHFNNEGWKEALRVPSVRPRPTGRGSARKPSWAHIPSSLTSLWFRGYLESVASYHGRVHLRMLDQALRPSSRDFQGVLSFFSDRTQDDGDSYRRRSSGGPSLPANSVALRNRSRHRGSPASVAMA